MSLFKRKPTASASADASESAPKPTSAPVMVLMGGTPSATHLPDLERRVLGNLAEPQTIDSLVLTLARDPYTYEVLSVGDRDMVAGVMYALVDRGLAKNLGVIDSAGQVIAGMRDVMPLHDEKAVNIEALYARKWAHRFGQEHFCITSAGLEEL